MSENIDINVGIIKEEISINAANNIVEVNISTAPVTIINPQNYDLSQFTNTSPNPFVQQSGLASYVPISRIITINGIAQDLSTDRSWTVFASANKMVTIGRNATGSTLYKGTIVYILGSTGNRPNFVKAQANTESTSAGTFGVIESDIPNNSDGNCVTIGTIDNLDTRSTATHPFTTDTLADGDTIYLSPNTAGYITNVKPYAPSHLVYVGKVVRTSPTNGTIVYRIQNGYELDELHDVAAQTPSNNDVLGFESSTNLWKNKSIPTWLGYTPVPETRTLTINGVTQDLSANRTFTISTGITIGSTVIASGVVGRVLFEGVGNVVQESSSLFWDATNNRLGIGTSSPNSALEVVDTNAASYVAAARFLVPNNNVAGRVSQFYLGQAMTTRNSITWSFHYQGNGSTANYQSFGFNGITNPALTMFGTLNVGIGTTTDAGFKLDVNGTARVKGTGTTSATTAFTVQNSDGTNILNVKDDGAIQIGSRSTSQRPYLAGYTGFSEFGVAQSTLGIVTQFSSTQRPDPGVLIKNSANIDFTSNTGNYLVLVANYTPTSGTGVFNNFVITPTINQTGGANGITRGLYVNPTLTAAADFRAIETTAGNVIFNGGNVGIGTSTPAYALDVVGGFRIGSSTIKLGMGESGGNSVFVGSLTNQPLKFLVNTNEYARIATTGNVLINTTTDAGFRLDVNGSARVRGAGTTVATASLTVQNGAGTASLICYDDLAVYIDGKNQSGFATNIRIGGQSNQATINFFGNNNIYVGQGGSIENIPSALIAMGSTTKGFLPPRMTTTQKNAIASPATGLQVFDTTLNQMSYYNGTTWTNI